MALGSMIPPVIMEVKAKANEVSAEMKAQEQVVIASLKRMAAESEKAAVAAEATAAKAAARADELAAKASTQTGEAAVKTAALAEEAAAQAKVAAEAATTARAEADAAATKVQSAAAGTAAAASQLNRVAKAAFLGTAVAAAAVGYEAVKMGGDYQQSVNLLATGAGELRSNLSMVGAEMLRVSSETGTGAKETANAMYYIESAGFHGADGIKVLTAALQGAKTDGADAKETADALTTAMEDMHAPASQAADIMSKMVAAVGQGKMKMQDFAGSIHSVLPNASALGISFEQVAGALATMTAQGISADQAAQNLNHVIVALANPTRVQTQTMAAYGLSSLEVSKNLGKNGLTGTLDILFAAVMKQSQGGVALQNAFMANKVAAEGLVRMFSELPPAVQKIANEYVKGQMTAKEFEGQLKGMPLAVQAQGAQFATAAKNASGFSQALRSGKGDLQTITGALSGMTGGMTGLQVALHLGGKNADDFKAKVKAIGAASADAKGNVKDWEEVQKNFNQQMSVIKTTVENYVITLGLHLIPVLSAVIGFFMQHTTTTKVLLGVLGVAVGLLATYGGILFGIAAYTKAVALATDMWRIAQLLAGGAMKVLTAAQWLLNAAMDANPIGLIVLAVAALVAGLIYAYTHSTTFRNIVNATFHAVATAAQWMWDKIKAFAEWFGGAFMAVVHAVETAWTASWNFIKAVISAVMPVIRVAMDIIAIATLPVRIAMAVLVAAFKIGWAIIVDVVKIAWLAVKAVWDLLRQYVIGPLTSVITAYIAFWRGVWNVAVSILQSAIRLLLSVWNTAWGAITSVARAAWGVLSPVFSFIGNTAMGWIRTGISQLTGAWNTGWGAISRAVSSAWNFIRPIISAIVNGIHTAANAANAIVGSISSAGNTISGFLSHIPGLAGGTDNWGGGVTWVGENGPELVWLPPHTAVTPNRESLRMTSGIGAGATDPGGGGGLPGHAMVAVTVVQDGIAVQRVNQRAQLQWAKRNGTSGTVAQ